MNSVREDAKPAEAGWRRDTSWRWGYFLEVGVLPEWGYFLEVGVLPGGGYLLEVMEEEER